ncbi:YjfB family protein [Acetatifactor muris]|jgi:hypothetical protein|uniref:Motility protein n=1 Tax=Acetatifactor muris TaxID=879566 RepID=A0A2K4ZBE7_9FIRM|nr:YjfB family protein [Acetatifactor muris]MCR2046110.1 YjfB family protein [Acetatifactor muris]SOY27782.1 hypothetical protein AMURIS_00487 [Acetatifactor muris]
MDITGVALANVTELPQIGTAVLSKAMDTSEALGAGIVEMIDAAAMELSVNPYVGANFDMRV